MTSPFTHVNTTSVESPYGFRTINLYQGDICNAGDEVLVVSSAANPEFPPSGAVIRALIRKYALDFTKLNPVLVLWDAVGTHLLADQQGMPYRKILVVRMPGASVLRRQGLNPIRLYREIVWSVFGSLAALELRGDAFGTMSLPLLGGQRGYPIEESMAVLLEQATRWLKTSRSMHTVNFWLLREEKIAAWRDAMNRVLGRRLVSTAHSHVVSALSAEILSRSKSSARCQSEEVRHAMDALENALADDPICLQLVAAFGRVLVEQMVHTICTQHGVVWKGSLLSDIESLRKADRVAPWMISHFHSLRIFGNETVHAKGEVAYRPESLRDEDLLPILASLLRILSFWDAWE